MNDRPTTDSIGAAPAGTTKLGVVVVNYGSHELIDSNLGALDVEQCAVELCVVVVDNLSTPEERELISLLCAARGWTLCRPSENLGFGGGANLGASAAIAQGADVLVFLNPDVVAGPAALDALAARAMGDERRLLCSPEITRPDGSTWFAGGQIDLSDGSTSTRADAAATGRGRWLTGACLAVRSDVWTELGGFDERYFMYWEDIELSQRCLERGGELVVDRTVTVVHDVGGTQRGDADHGAPAPKSDLYTYYVNRNRLLFAADHVSGRIRRRWVLATPRSAVRVALRTGRRSALSRPSYLWATVRGVIDGLRLLRSGRPG